MRFIFSTLAMALALTVMTVSANKASAVEFDFVGAGHHYNYGPQDNNGAYLGVVQESYDWWVDGQWGTEVTTTVPSGAVGHLLIGFNPYTGEVWSGVDPANMRYHTDTPAVNPTYTGHLGNVQISGPSGLVDDPGTVDIDESLVYSAAVTNTTAPVGGMTDDAVLITAESREDPGGGWGLFGAGVSTSPDGGIYGDTLDEPVTPFPNWNYDHDMAIGETVGSGAVVLTGASGVAGHVGAHNNFGYTGTMGGGIGNYGFTMDGGFGWVKLAFSGDRSGVRLMESYFEPGGVNCGVGDADCDGDVDLDDVIAAVGSFTGPCTAGVDCYGDPGNGASVFNKVRADGDVNNGASVTGVPPLQGDGDVDLDDIIDMVGAFTGPLDSEEFAAAAAGDPGLPDLRYDSATGEVFLDAADIGGTLQAYNIKNAGGGILNGNFTAILGGPPATDLPTEIGEFQLSSTATPPGGLSIGLVFPAGMDQAQLEAFVTGGSAAPSFGGGSFAWELIAFNVGPGVPEPATVTLLGIGLMGLALVGYRRRRNA